MLWCYNNFGVNLLWLIIVWCKYDFDWIMYLGLDFFIR